MVEDWSMYLKERIKSGQSPRKIIASMHSKEMIQYKYEAVQKLAEWRDAGLYEPGHTLDTGKWVEKS